MHLPRLRNPGSPLGDRLGTGIAQHQQSELAPTYPGAVLQRRRPSLWGRLASYERISEVGHARKSAAAFLEARGFVVWRRGVGLGRSLDLCRYLFMPRDSICEVLFQPRRRRFREKPSGSSRRCVIEGRGSPIQSTHSERTLAIGNTRGRRPFTPSPGHAPPGHKAAREGRVRKTDRDRIVQHPAHPRRPHCPAISPAILVQPSDDLSKAPAQTVRRNGYPDPHRKPALGHPDHVARVAWHRRSFFVLRARVARPLRRVHPSIACYKSYRT
jgi:hypothetical protein